MATKDFCDRCGKEIKPHKLFRPNGKIYDCALEYTFQIWGWGRKTYDLCYSCAMAVRKFMNETREDSQAYLLDDEEE